MHLFSFNSTVDRLILNAQHLKILISFQSVMEIVIGKKVAIIPMIEAKVLF